MHARDHSPSRPGLPGSLARAAVLGALLVSAGCSESEAPLDWQAIDYPLFESLEEEFADLSTATIESRRSGAVDLTEVPEEIRWAPDMEAAIERATLEDKPIFIASSVRKGGLNKSGCDV